MKAAQKLKNYILSEKLGESLQAVVYKAYLKEQPELPLILKQLKFLSGWADLSRYLRQKIERLKVLRDKRSCTPLAMESDLERHFIVQPWFAGNTLDAWSEGQKKLALADFFSIACSMADILRVVHEAGIVHGGIKPHNILVQAETLSVCLTDFITPLDIRDISHFIYDSGFVRGTLAYTSPEQTGRINHRVDFTTDLYSLGVVFYELLTGRLPFLSTDPLELIHSHLAEIEPVAHECNPSVPSQISEIIAKLLSKSPERRYQSAGGLLADLLRCRDEYLATNAIIPFQLGLLDSTKRIIFISKMVGRKAEADLILDEYLQVTQGAFLSVFVSGLSGIGKTRLIQELQKPLVEHRGYFTSGKMRALAVSEDVRSSSLPDVPTFREAGFPDVVTTNWFGFSTVAALPPDLAKRWESEIGTALKSEQVMAAFAKIGVRPGALGPEGYTSLIKGELARWKEVIAAANIKAD